MTRDEVLRADDAKRPTPATRKFLVMTNKDRPLIIPQDLVINNIMAFDVSPEAVSRLNIKETHIALQVSIESKVYCLDIPISSILFFGWADDTKLDEY